MSPEVYPEKLQWRYIQRDEPPKRPVCERLRDFHEIYSFLDADKVREQAARCVQCGHPFCVGGCPLNNRIPEWIALAAEGRFLEAAKISQQTSNMPEVCSRVCPQERLCEGACVLNVFSQPVTIGAIEMFINEYAFAHGGVDVTRAPSNSKRVAVVGAGPAGLACADELRGMGYDVTVFEALDRGGGLLVYGIPAFKLDKNVVERRVKTLEARGVQFRMKVVVGRDVTVSKLLGEFDAVFLGIGAQKPKPLNVPGGELRGVYDALPFLIEKNLGLPETTDVHNKLVAVVGGGDTAMDCLRTAIRCGARSAVCLYRRDEANMPGSRKEYKNAIEEGAQFQFLVNPILVCGDSRGDVQGVRCVRMELGEPDASGRRKPRPVRNSEFNVRAEVVLVAYGFDPVPMPAGDHLPDILRNKWGMFEVNPDGMTNIPGLFSGGDAVRGPSLVAHAIRDGRHAARSIDRYLSTAARCCSG